MNDAVQLRRPGHPLMRPDTAGVVLLALALASAPWTPLRLLLACWLAAWWCMLGLVMGSCITLWIHALTGGRWGAALRPAAALVVRRRIGLLPLFMPIALGLRVLYPWAAPDDHTLDLLDLPRFAQAWLGLPAFACRCVGYAALWYWLAGSALQPAIARVQAALNLVLYGLTGSLAAVDLLMSLVPGWRSTGFPLLALMAQALGGAALLIAWTALRTPARLSAAVAPRVPLARDLGNLLLMFVLVWGYLGFMQFLIIWAENLPHEIAWFVPRVHTKWYAVGALLVAAQLAVPLAALLFRDIKDRPARLGAVALLTLAANALDCVWLVVPSVDAHALAAWWLAPLCLAGMGLLLFSPMLAAPAMKVQHARA